jgi:hypothetical protein
MERIRIGAYKEKSSGNLTIFPLTKTPIGYYTAINKPLVVVYPYTAEEVGDSCVKCIETVISNNFSTDDRASNNHKKR